MPARDNRLNRRDFIQKSGLAATLTGLAIVPRRVLGGTGNVPPSETVNGTGTIQYQDIEGGFYGIVMENGTQLLPVNLTDEFKVNGTYIQFEATILDDQNSITQWGTLVQIEAIELAMVSSNLRSVSS